MNRFKRSKLFYSAFFALSAGVCCGAANTVVTEPFATAGDLATNYSPLWSGNGIVEEGTKTAPAAAGLPIADENSNVLTVEGQVNCAAATADGNMASVDMMVRVEEPDEVLSATSLGSDSSTIQIALASEYSGTENNTENIPLKLWCKAKATDAAAAWNATGLTAAPGSWHRVSFLFDYAHGRCQVRIDGVLLDSENGYQTATDTTSASGSWFKLAYVPASGSQKISSFTVKGCTAIDDVLVLDSANAAEVTPGIAGDAVVDDVRNSWFVENNLPANTARSATDASGMTYKDKFLSGVKIGADKFEFTDMSMKTEGGTVKAQLTFPINQAAPGYKNVIKYSKDKTFATGVNEVDASADGTAVIDVAKESSGPTVYYYKLETVPVSAN